MKLAPLFFILGTALWAVDAEIFLTPPEINGQSQRMKDLFNAELDKLEVSLTGDLRAALVKPLFLTALADADAQVAGLPGAWAGGGPSFGLRGFSAASLMADTFDIGQLISRASALGQNSDEPWGAAAQPLGGEAFLILPLVWGLSLDLSGGGWGFPLTVQGYTGEFSGWKGGAVLTGGRRPLLSWLEWLGIRAGAGYQNYTFGVSQEIRPEPIEKDFSIPMDDIFPNLPPQEFTLIITPVLQVDFRSGGSSVPLSLGTGLRLGGFLDLAAGGALVWSDSSSILSASGRSEIDLPYSEVEEENQQLLITDQNGDKHPGLAVARGSTGTHGARTWRGMLTGSLSLRGGPFFLHLPVSWEPAGGLGLGVQAGLMYSP